MTAPATPPAAAQAVDVTNEQFFRQVLAGLGIQANQQNLAALADVSHYEGNNTYFNPLNSVVHEAGSVVLPGNTADVQKYPNEAAGVQGTIDLLAGAHWDDVRAKLSGGSESQILSSFDAAYTWSPGTHIPALAPFIAGEEGRTPVGPASGGSYTNPGGLGGTGGPSSGQGSPTSTVLDPTGIIGEIESVLSWLAKPFENAAFVIGGVIVVIVGLVLLAKAGTNADNNSGGSSPGGNGGGASESPREKAGPGGNDGEATAGEAGEAEDAAVVA